MEHSILNTKLCDKTPIYNIREKTNAKDIIYIMEKSKFNFAGHIIRDNADKWRNKLIEWTPYMCTKEWKDDRIVFVCEKMN